MCELFNEANVLYNLLIVLFGPETLSYLGPKIWNLDPFDIRDCTIEQVFSKRLKNGNQIDVHVGSAKYLSIE